ncbi:MAG: oxidase [Bacilli bacterium]|nr:oxidase [Bacilli bacterium]
MRLQDFLYNLHFDIDKISPPDKQVDWEDAPLPYKLYRGLPVIPLSTDVPLSLAAHVSNLKPGLREIGHFLWYVYGLNGLCQTVDQAEQTAKTMQSYRRFVPSGGGLYPNELYVYLKVDDLPAGVYHYDVAHHRLVLLRAGNFDSYLEKSLGNRCEVSTCCGVAFVTTYFWKNFFKYNNFAYRLQGLDAGVLIGQLLEVAKRFGIETGVYFQFLDRAVNHLLGLSEQQESVYAVIPLSVEHAQTWCANGGQTFDSVSAADLCQAINRLEQNHLIRSERVLEYPLLKRMNEASLQESSGTFRQISAEKPAAGEGQQVTLPGAKRLSYDLAAACRNRYSPGMDFVLETVTLTQLSVLLQEAAASFNYRNDLDKIHENPVSRVCLYGCFYSVEGIPDGAYHYDSTAHALCLIRLGDHRFSLQQAMTLPTVNLYQVPLCFHVAGGVDHLQNEFGYRGYRIQQMEAGMLVQRLLLAASALGFGGHPLLGFDASSSDEMYKTAQQGRTSLIEVPVGPYRKSNRLEGGLHG